MFSKDQFALEIRCLKLDNNSDREDFIETVVKAVSYCTDTKTGAKFSRCFSIMLLYIAVFYNRGIVIKHY